MSPEGDQNHMVHNVSPYLGMRQRTVGGILNRLMVKCRLASTRMLPEHLLFHQWLDSVLHLCIVQRPFRRFTMLAFVHVEALIHRCICTVRPAGRRS